MVCTVRMTKTSDNKIALVDDKSHRCWACVVTHTSVTTGWNAECMWWRSPQPHPLKLLIFFIRECMTTVVKCNAWCTFIVVYEYTFSHTFNFSYDFMRQQKQSWILTVTSQRCQSQQLVSNWILTFCHLHRVTLGHSNFVISKHTFQKVFHKINLFSSQSTKPVPMQT